MKRHRLRKRYGHARLTIEYAYRGAIERGRNYGWREGYSATSSGGGALYPWMTKAECRKDAKSQGAKAIFTRNGKVER